MRTNRRRICKIVCFLSLAIFLFFNYGSKPKIKLEISMLIERSIRSPINQGSCRHPHLPIDNPEIMKFYACADSECKIDCGDSLDDWVTCEKSICFVKPQVRAKHGEMSCSYTDLIRTTDQWVKYGKTTKTKEPYILRRSDFVRVTCNSANSGASWSGMAFGIRELLQRTSKPLPRNNVPPPIGDAANVLLMAEPAAPFNVLIYGFDSLSRNAFIRTLPRTYDFLMTKLDAIVLKGFNILGDGTTMALVPLLTGHSELELPETRKRKSDSQYVDVYPFIWQDYARMGYVTAFNEDVPDIGTFTYRLNGFAEQPTDHYLHTYYVESDNMPIPNENHCIGHQPDHVVMLDYTKHFMTKYNDTPRFVFSFHGGLSHDSTNMIKTADDDVVAWLTALKEKHLFDNTILIFMSDHGSRFDRVRATLQGKQEERLPFYSFAFPSSFRKRFPQEYANFMGNAERLTTPYDVHATLKHLLQLQSVGQQLLNEQQQQSNNNIDMSTSAGLPTEAPPMLAIPLSKMASERAISLFDVVPQNRSCADAYIEPHWCACLRWHQIPTNDTDYAGLLLKLADSIVQTINAATGDYRSLCAPLELVKINWAMCLLPHKEVLQFKGSKDKDGFLPDLSDSTSLPDEVYQLQIVVDPGASLFEASVTLDLHTLQARTQLSQISRINKYGEQANCIYERNPDLRKYCYCRT